MWGRVAAPSRARKGGRQFHTDNLRTPQSRVTSVTANNLGGPAPILCHGVVMVFWPDRDRLERAGFPSFLPYAPILRHVVTVMEVLYVRGRRVDPGMGWITRRAFFHIRLGKTSQRHKPRNPMGRMQLRVTRHHDVP